MSKRDRSTGKNKIGDFTDPALVSILTGWLESSGAAELEIVAADGQALKIVLGAGAHASRKEEAKGEGSGRSSFPGNDVAVKAPAAGRFRATHPTADAAQPLRAGHKLPKGGVAGFVEIGPVLVPVVASRAGTIRDCHARSGDLIGYGASILTMEPL